MIEALTTNPAFGASALPLGVALAVTALIWLIGGPYRAPMIVFSAAIVGIVAAFWWIEGLPPILPTTGKQKIFYLILLALAAGWAIDGREGRRRADGLERLSLFGLPVLALIWLAWRPLVAGPDTRLLIEMAVLWLAAVAVYWRLRKQERAGALVGGVQVLVAAMGLSVVALLGASASLASLAGAVAAAMGGVLLWLFVVTVINDERFGFGALGWLACAGALLFIADVVVLFSPEVNRWSLALLLLVFVTDKVPLGRRRRGALDRAAQPVLLGLVAAVPAVAAVGVALLSGGGASPY